MRYGIFSDIHSNLEALDAVIEAYKKERVDRYLCAGDVVGYATNPSECIEKVKALVSVTVAGNHDWASVGLFSLEHFNAFAKEALLWTKRNLNDEERHFLQSLKLVYKNKDLTLVHGTLDEPQDFNYLTDGYIAEQTFNILETDICFVGHTHLPGAFIKNNANQLSYQEGPNFKLEGKNKYIVNLGSVGQPRDNNPKAAYCVYDTDNKEVWIKRADYDNKTTRKKILDEGLPKFLGDRLLEGR